ncbi:MAG: UvrD-helicase domain-containing protein [Vulcanimicrobiota bacterium]
MTEFTPTDEQRKVIEWPGSAFISACPGAGKTRVMVERARVLLSEQTGKGIAFLSFTNAAVSELAHRLNAEDLLQRPPFPHFVGTFDSFLWHFFITPFGIPGSSSRPWLMPDKNERRVSLGGKARPIPLQCFDRDTGEMLANEAARIGFKPDASAAARYATAVRGLRRTLLESGGLDHDDVREFSIARTQDERLAPRLQKALASRFAEVIVDEAQDCNPQDLVLVKFLRDSGIVVKVICDPQQSIYGFRGGVADELIAFGKTFVEEPDLTLTGTFRTTPAICRALAALRPNGTGTTDQPLGRYREDATPIHVFRLAKISDRVASSFYELVRSLDLSPSACPILAATKRMGANATGQAPPSDSEALTIRLAEAVMDFHFAIEPSKRISSLERVYRMILELEGRLGELSFREFLVKEGAEPMGWRPVALGVVKALKYTVDQGVEQWLAQARKTLGPHLRAGRKIGNLLKSNKNLPNTLRERRDVGGARTIHSAKGQEFPAVCVVLPRASFLDFLENGTPAELAEDARKIYVGASRAQRLLCFAIPENQSPRVIARLESADVPVKVIDI